MQEDWDINDPDTVMGQCNSCEKMRPIQRRNDPYLAEVYEESKKKWYCRPCWEERKNQI